MEKQTAELRKHFQRLLSFLFCVMVAMWLPSLLCAEDTSFAYEKNRIVSLQKYCFTDSDSQFTLQLEGAAPNKVQSYVENVPENVVLVSSRKDELAGNGVAAGVKGTMIQLWFQFKKPGTYQIGNLIVNIAGKVYKYQFSPITVYENPNTVQPCVMLEFYNQSFPSTGGTFSCRMNEHIRFTVYIRYAVQIINFAWDIPQDSIFEQVKLYEITEELPRGNTFSPETVPVATFDWQPLKTGSWHFPTFQITATSYNGGRVDLTLPDYTINVLPAIQKNSVSDDSGVFAYAFTEPNDISSVKEVTALTPEKLKQLLQLRSKERHSFPFNAAAKERRSIEETEGLASGENEPSIPFFVLTIYFCMVLIAATIILFVLKRTKGASICVVCSLLLMIGVILGAVKISRQYALFTGGTVSPIPEEDASSIVVMQTGSRVEIQKDTGTWVYIKYNDTYGWVLKSKVYYIK